MTADGQPTKSECASAVTLAEGSIMPVSVTDRRGTRVIGIYVAEHGARRLMIER